MTRVWLLAAVQGVAVAAAALVVQRRHPGRPLVAGLAVAMGFAFPLAGPLCAWWTLARGERSPTWRDDLPVPPAPLPAELDASAALARELAVNPLSDRIRAGDREGRQAAARALADLGDARAVRVLEGALEDPDPDTRLFASIALVRLEAAFAARLARARDAEDPLVLARAVRTYLASGLPQGLAARELWAELARAGDESVEAEPDGLRIAGLAGRPKAGEAFARSRAEVWVHLAAARRALGDLEGARLAAEQALAIAPVMAGALELCEALYALGDVPALSDAARRLCALTPPGSTAHQAARMWLVEGA